MRQNFILLLVIILAASCMTDAEKRMSDKKIRADSIFFANLNGIRTYQPNYNIENLRTKYFALDDSLKIIFADSVRDVKAFMMYNHNKENDKGFNLKLESEDERLKKWHRTTAGKIHLKHPDWSEEDCENIANRKIWIGMHVDMIKYYHGKPDSAKPSNYGGGVQWQWCWNDMTPSCFYGGESGIVTSYN